MDPVETEQELTQEQLEQEELKGFAEAFEKDVPIGDVNLPEEEESETPPTGEQPEGTGTEEGEVKTTETPPVTELEKPPALTIDELANRLAVIESKVGKQIDTAFGKMGDLQRALRNLQEISGKVGSIDGNWTEEDFKELATEYPEICAKIVNGFNSGLKRLSVKQLAHQTPTPSAPATQTDQGSREDSQARAQQEQRQRAWDHMEWTRPGWRDIIGDEGQPTEFRQWLATQPHDYQVKVNETWNPAVLNEALNNFDTFKASQKAPEPPKTSDPPKQTQTTPKGQNQRQILKGAVPPKTTGKVEKGGRAMTEEEAFAAGFNG